jgi:hypothetical protein
MRGAVADGLHISVETLVYHPLERSCRTRYSTLFTCKHTSYLPSVSENIVLGLTVVYFLRMMLLNIIDYPYRSVYIVWILLNGGIIDHQYRLDVFISLLGSVGSSSSEMLCLKNLD